MRRTAGWGRARLLLLLLLLLAFTRLVWQLEAKDLWLDEAFSLQRAESSWLDLLKGSLPLTDGVRTVDTTDQHPFAYFVFLGLMMRVAGKSEFALRFPAVISAVLLTPAAWVLARRLARIQALPASAPGCVALLVALSPFYLWFGQEVRMYALVALLALLSTYLLLRWAGAIIPAQRRLYLAGYALAVFLLLTSHYFAVLILPIHAAIVFEELWRKDRRRALLAVAAILGLALVSGGIAVWLLARDPGAGTNWSHISLRILVPDLLNAFSLGLSVDLAQVWPLDLFYGLLALIGASYGLLRLRKTVTPYGWVLPAAVVVPPALLLAINTIRPAYMTARHMSLISGFFVLLVGGGLAWLWEARRWAGAGAAVLLVAGATYSTINNLTLPLYGNGEVKKMGEYLHERIQPGDLLLLQPVPWGRLYRYYLPLDEVEQGERAGANTGWRALPLLGLSSDQAIHELAGLSQHYQRIWLARAGEPDPAADWLLTHTFRADDRAFANPRTALNIALMLPQSPVRDRIPAGIQHPVDVVFGNQVRLIGYDLGQPLAQGAPIPVTFYWQPVSAMTKRYKYILRLVADRRWLASGDSPGPQVLATTETEPYNGFLPTTLWPVGSTVVEYSSVPSSSGVEPGNAFLTLQIYDAETLEKLPLMRVSGAQGGEDTNTAVLPVSP